MKTIDEAINKCRDLAYGDIDPFEAYHIEGFKDEEYEQLANWLEELKDMKEGSADNE